MANFFLIDHSLSKPGGHHFDYVRCVAQAANQLGFLTTIGANRSLKQPSTSDPEGIYGLGNIRRVFRDTTYQSDSYLAGLQHLTRSDCLELLNVDDPKRTQRYWKSLKLLTHRRRRERFVRRFAIDCERYFRPLLQMPGDHAFLTTVSELELMGLAVYLSQHPKTLNTNWHLQFHFNLFDGRTPEYEGQDKVLQTVRSCCLAALSRLSSHSVHFYTTSDVLVDQYNQLGVGEFDRLPYPISPEFSPAFSPQKNDRPVQFGPNELASIICNSESHADHHSPVEIKGGTPRESSIKIANPFQSETVGDFDEPNNDGFARPIRITCPGEVRREKGHIEYLQPLVDEIWPTHLSSGNVQVVVQRPAKKWHATKEKIALDLPVSQDPQSAAVESPIQYFSHPLNHEDYVNLIKSTDCGLLFYDSRVYFSRRAGVLGELLACGKPVIVPAGSWLAEQIAEPIFRHTEDTIDRSIEHRIIEPREFGWDRRNVPMPGGVLSFDQSNHPFDFSIEREPQENAMVIEFDWHWPKAAGTFCHLRMSQKNSDGEITKSTRRVIGYRRSNRKSNALFQVDADTRVVEFSLTNAFHHSTASINRVKLRTMEVSPDPAVLELPIGSVGVVAADENDLPACVDEIVTHFDHYRETALAFSKQWYSRHDPIKTVNHLISVSESMESPLRRAA